MKILYVCADLGIPVLGGKGAAVHVRAMADAFRASGHQVVVAAGQVVKSPWQRPVASDLDVLHIPPGPEIVYTSSRLRAFAAAIGATSGAAGEVRRTLYNQELLTALRQRFEHDPPDLVYERASLFGIAGLTFAREAGVPHLLELNAPLTDEQQRYRGGGALCDLAQDAETWVLRHTDAVLAVSGPLADHVVALGVDRSRVHVVPNGVDTSRFRPDGPNVRAALGLDGRQVLGFVGGLRPWHGVDAIPRAVHALASTHRRIHALVVGDGPLRGDLLREAARLGVQDKMTLVGTVSHELVPDYIRACDVAVAPYPAAAHAFYFSPLKLFEYMACGLPVVAASLGQIAEVVSDGETGRLYPAGDDAAFVRACEVVLADPATARAMGARASALVTHRFTWAHNAARAIALATGVGHPSEVYA